MSEPSPNPEQQILEESTSTPTPLANGTALPADIEMADSAPIPAAEVTSPMSTLVKILLKLTL